MPGARRSQGLSSGYCREGTSGGVQFREFGRGRGLAPPLGIAAWGGGLWVCGFVMRRGKFLLLHAAIKNVSPRFTVTF